MFEAGATKAELEAATGIDDSRVYEIAIREGWDRDARAAAFREKMGNQHVVGMFAKCKKCGELRHLSNFGINGTRDDGTSSHRSTCRRCTKRAKRRRQGTLPRREWQAKRAERLAAEKAARKRSPTAKQLHRELRSLLRALLRQRIEASGDNWNAFEFRWRYRNDPVFRDKQIARTWARKAASGVLRTDSRSGRRVSDDGTLTPAVIRRLFATADRCPYCQAGLHPRDKTLDHLVPVSRGGAHSIENVAVCCRRCNMRKRTRTPLEWLVSEDGRTVLKRYCIGRPAGAGHARARKIAIGDTAGLNFSLPTAASAPTG
jgi:5-methylcytosine-specific restriction endonuclease McrA